MAKPRYCYRGLYIEETARNPLYFYILSLMTFINALTEWKIIVLKSKNPRIAARVYRIGELTL